MGVDCSHKPKSATHVAVQSIVRKAFSSQNLVPSSFRWSEGKVSFRGLQASEQEKELFKFQYNV